MVSPTSSAGATSANHEDSITTTREKRFTYPGDAMLPKILQTKHWAGHCNVPVFRSDFLWAHFGAQDHFGVGSLFASEIDGLGTAPMTIPSLYEGLIVTGYTQRNKIIR